MYEMDLIMNKMGSANQEFHEFQFKKFFVWVDRRFFCVFIDFFFFGLKMLVLLCGLYRF